MVEEEREQDPARRCGVNRVDVHVLAACVTA